MGRDVQIRWCSSGNQFHLHLYSSFHRVLDEQSGQFMQMQRQIFGHQNWQINLFYAWILWFYSSIKKSWREKEYRIFFKERSTPIRATHTWNDHLLIFFFVDDSSSFLSIVCFYTFGSKTRQFVYEKNIYIAFGNCGESVWRVHLNFKELINIHHIFKERTTTECLYFSKRRNNQLQLRLNRTKNRNWRHRHWVAHNWTSCCVIWTQNISIGSQLLKCVASRWRSVNDLRKWRKSAAEILISLNFPEQEMALQFIN